MKPARHELQHTCQHRKVKQSAQPEIETHPGKHGGDGYSVKVVHLHCADCGMYFSREDWATKRIIHG